jgi:hypothetical protein
MPGVYAYSPTPGQQGPAGTSRPAREPQPSTYTEVSSRLPAHPAPPSSLSDG